MKRTLTVRELALYSLLGGSSLTLGITESFAGTDTLDHVDNGG